MTRTFQGHWLTRRHINYGLNEEKYYQKNPSVIYSGNFNLEKVISLKLKICVLGYYILKINGRLASNTVLNNDWTYFSKRKYYDEYDITGLIHLGENFIEVELGNGMYNPFPLKFFGKHNFRHGLKDVGEPKFVLDLLDLEGNVIFTSNSAWHLMTGDRIFNNLFLGEEVDSSFKGKRLSYKTVKLTEKEQQTLVKSFIPKIREFEPIHFVKMSKKGEKLVIDFGKTTSGFLKLNFECTKNKKVQIFYCETKENGKLAYETSFAGGIGNIPGITGGPGSPEKAFEKDVIYAKKGTNNFKNKFTYHSFRYIEIENLSIDEIKSIFAIPVHTDLSQTGLVKTNNTFLNNLFDAGINTRLNNVHSVYEDCARERLQYGGDIVALITAMSDTFDLSQFNRKVIDDFLLGQTDRGGIPETAPYMGIQTNGTGDGEGPLLWQIVFPYLIYKYYQYYADQKFVADRYPYVKKQYDYLMSWDLSTLAQKDIGDHASPKLTNFYEATPDKTFVGYCTILLFNELTIKISNISGKETNELLEENRKIRKTIDQLYKNEDGTYGQRSQTAFAFALFLNLGSKNILLKGLEKKIKDEKNIFNCGIFGQSILYTILHKENRDDIVYKWLTKSGEISFKHMLSNGNQVLKEQFTDGKLSDSGNHAMFASYLKWYFEALGGISLTENAVGFSKISVNPYFNDEVTKIKTSINTMQGKIDTKTIFKKNHWHYYLSLPNKIEYTLGTNLKSFTITMKKTESRTSLHFCQK